MITKRRTILFAELAGVTLVVLLGTLQGQTLPQLKNGIRNVFSEAGPVPDPEPPGPTERTGNQFAGSTSYGGWVLTRVKDRFNVVLAGSTNESAGPPGAILIPSYTPLGKDGVTPIPSQKIYLQAVKMSRPMVLRTVSFPLGSTIPRPDRRPNGTPLDPLVFADREFYYKEPANAVAGKFYWSPHAEQVFANQPGLITIDWEERVSGNIFTQTYTISGSPAKPAKKIYWTQGEFNGPVVDVPEARVGEVNIVYNATLFPERVPITESFDFDPDNPYDPNNPGIQPPPEQRTLWHDNIDGNIHAYNIEGRVFVELLGDLRGVDRIYREHLGFEIVDVIQEIRPDELRVSIGEQVLPVDEAELTLEEDALVPDVVAGMGLNADPYLYQHFTLGGTKRNLYAIRKTTPLRLFDLNEDGVIDELDEQQSNEVLIYWKEAGVMDLLWPKTYVGYIFKWPEEYLAGPASEGDLRGLYSVYARPEVVKDALPTGIRLDSNNNPELVYQDDPTRQHARVSRTNIFYTDTTSGNRALIRYTNGEEIWFERVYSIDNEDFDGYNSSTPAIIGTRIAPPPGVESAVGYIRQTQGNAFNEPAYLDPFVEGFDDAAEGVIIPVNALTGNDILEIWWYEPNIAPAGTTFNTIHWPSRVMRYQLQWPVTDPDDLDLFDEIVMARNDGSGELGIAATGQIYRQPDPNLPGFNPNEEHALMSGGVAWALRDDLNQANTSEPFVLVDYTAEDDRPAMVIRRVVRENAQHTFDYEAPVGVILQSPMPLPFLPLPIDPQTGEVQNTEVPGPPTDEPVGFLLSLTPIGSPAADNHNHYRRFTYIDRKGTTWIYRGPHEDAVNVGSVNDPSKNFKMHYFYKTQPEFDFPAIDASNSPPDVGTIVPYLRAYTNGTDPSGGFEGDVISGPPLEVGFTPVWPDNPAVLNIGESLGLPKKGLPAVRGQISARVLYEQSIGQKFGPKPRSVKLFDPTRAKTYLLDESFLDALPDSLVTSDYQGKTYFPNLPPHLSERLFFDPNIGPLGALVFIGEFIDAPLGEDYFQLNVMSPEDIAAANALVAPSDLRRTFWEDAFTSFGLKTTMVTRVPNPGVPGTYMDGPTHDFKIDELAEIFNDDTPVDSYAISAAGGGTGYVVMIMADGNAFVPEANPIQMEVFKVAPPLYDGELKVVQSANPLDEKLTLQHSGDFSGDPTEYEFAWITAQPVAGFPPDIVTNFAAWQEVTPGAKADAGEVAKVRHTIEGASIFTLTDNYFAMRYRALPNTEAALATGGTAVLPGGWSEWTSPQLAEGWIKRALAGINPFQQRVTDLFSNRVNTDVSLLTQAGPRWEGNIALNLANIDDFGLIEIYETILNRGKDLSIEGAPPLNVPAANDALLLAAGYLNDLYLLVGNEAFADASNPTIAFDTDGTFGEFNTALYAFKGQLSSVLEEELALLRGRDDHLQPGVEVMPVYNRLIWNFTRGINSGEPIYSLNYNIQDNNADGAADATDATVQYPQGHGDAYGHYLTALKGYYSLFRSTHFAWTPRVEAVLVLGQPVSVDYQDERKFATAAAALARSASQILDLTYRKEYTGNENVGWAHLRDGEVNPLTGTARHWGTDDWATRAGQGSYFNWVTGNSVLPEEDTINVGIQKVDRTTVPELNEVVSHAEVIQRSLDNADARLSPLGLAKGVLPFDISPSEIDDGKTHYEQVYERAIGAMQNAVFAFNNAKRSTEFLRGQENGVTEQRAAIDAQERAFENQLIEIYGTPYPDDIGPGKTYPQGYTGPDLLHFGYVDTPELFFDPSLETKLYKLPLDPVFVDGDPPEVDFGDHALFRLNSEGAMVKPDEWLGRRAHPGSMQTAVSNLFNSRRRLKETLDAYDEVTPRMLELLSMYQARAVSRLELVEFKEESKSFIEEIEATIRSTVVIIEKTKATIESVIAAADAISEALPRAVGFSNDLTSIARGVAKAVGAATATASAIAQAVDLGKELGLIDEAEQAEEAVVAREEDTAWKEENRQLIDSLKRELMIYRARRAAIDVALREFDQATRDLQTLKSEALVIQAERETFRKRAAAIIQGYRTRDLAFRVFRDEALEKYKSLFDLAARYTFLAARAYDYETGLLDGSGSNAAAAFYDGIVQSRALGVVDGNGVPQFTASTTGDPGLAGVLAQMQGDWSVAKTRLGFNNPDRYRTIFSLRQENFRIVPNEAGDGAWKDQLSDGLMNNVLDDPDVRRYAMQIGNAEGLPVPGLVIPFQTTIADGFNFFGQPLAGGDHGFSPTSFATKIRASGIAFQGYVGMDDPTSIGGIVNGAGGQTPPDPNLGFLDPDALSATPYIYLIPVGVDSMRSPPLGDTSKVRSWAVDDQAIPLPFNIGNTDFSDNDSFVSSDSLSEDPFAIRKHQAFRAVPSGTVFPSAPGFTNSRLIGRSVWNSSWKIIIPGKTLRANPDVGLEVFLDSVKDIELFLETYSYSGN